MSWLRRHYDQCCLCWRPARRGGYLLCLRCKRRHSV